MADGAAQTVPFVWATGMEDTFVVHESDGHRRLDELELVGHYAAWREDLDRAAAIGFDALRCGIPWYRVEPQPGQFDWGWTDELLTRVVELGMQPIADLVHYGTPLWMPQAFADPDYPSRVGAYAHAFAQRYGQLVRHFTPVNEPAVTALVCGYAGRWPPYLTGDSGYVRVLDALCRGIVAEAVAIRAERPDAVIVHVEGTGFWIAADAPHDVSGAPVAERIYAALDLLGGTIDAQHELYPYLSQNGLTDDDLAFYREHAMVPDVIGVNYYPDGSVHRLVPDAAGNQDAIETVWGGTAHLAAAIGQFHARYGRPIFVSETGCNERSAAWVPSSVAGQAVGASAFRSRWLDELVAMLRSVRADGIPLWGCTWWPLVDAVSWDYRRGDRPVDAYLEPGGLVRLAPGADGRLERHDLPVGAHMREVIAAWT